MNKKSASNSSFLRDTTTNQLTLIVAVIIIVVAAIAVAFALAVPDLSTTQVWVFMAALIVFPFFSIAVITWLILRHSKKLIVSENDSLIEWEPIPPEVQKLKLNNEVKELSKILNISDEQLSDLRSAYIVAEDLAMRKIQNESETPLMRKVMIGKADFDGVWVDKDLITCIDVTFVVAPKVDQRKIDRVMRKAADAKSTLSRSRKGTKVRLLLAIVTQLEGGNDADLKSDVKSKFKTTPVDVDVRFMDFLNLQKIYAED